MALGLPALLRNELALEAIETVTFRRDEPDLLYCEVQVQGGFWIFEESTGKDWNLLIPHLKSLPGFRHDWFAAVSQYPFELRATVAFERAAKPVSPMLACATQYTLEFVRRAMPFGVRRILEVGCGNGALAAELCAEGFKVVAIDSDPECVAAAMRRGVDVRQAEWPAFADGLFDVVLFTRSLHHVRDLQASIAAAFAALAENGRIIVEDFLAEGEPQRSANWFTSLVRLLHRSGLLPRPTVFLAQRLGLAVPEPEHHDHDLHDSTAIEQALAAASATLEREDAAYYFRYLLDALEDSPELGEALLAHEQALIAAKLIDPLGRRYVATRDAR